MVFFCSYCSPLARSGMPTHSLGDMIVLAGLGDHDRDSTFFGLFLGKKQTHGCEKCVFCNTMMVGKAWSTDEKRWIMCTGYVTVHGVKRA